MSFKISSSVLNYGVGNYGIDQALLRFDKVYIPKNCKYSVLAFVPETISRIQSYWKHYLEFGNTFAFKPRFILNGEKLKLIKQYIKDFEDYDNVKTNRHNIRKYDRFYSEKFKKYSFSFPYIFSFFKNFKYNSKIFTDLTFNFFIKDSKINEKLFDYVMKNNLINSQKLYNEEESTKLLKAINRKIYYKI